MLSALGNRRLLAYLAGNLFSIVGTWGQRVALIWLAWEMTRSTTVLGILAALDLAPSIVVAPFAGSLADRRPVRILARNLQLVSVLPSLAFLGLLWSDAVSIPALMGLALVIGIVNGMDHPIRLSLVGSVVPRSQVPSAVALNSMAFNVGRMIGPVLGGWAVSAGALSAILLLNVASFALFALILTWLRLVTEDRDERRSPVPGGTAPSGWLSIVGQMSPIDRALALYFAAIALMLRPVFELLPDYAMGNRDEAVIFSTLTSTQGLGALIGALVTAVCLSRLSSERFALLAGAIAVAASVLFALSKNYALALVALGGLAGAILANGIATQVILQTRLPEAIRGRALSLYTMTFRGLPAIGTLVFGLAAEHLPERLLLLATTATIALLTVVLIVLQSRQMKKSCIKRSQ